MSVVLRKTLRGRLEPMLAGAEASDPFLALCRHAGNVRPEILLANLSELEAVDLLLEVATLFANANGVHLYITRTSPGGLS